MDCLIHIWNDFCSKNLVTTASVIEVPSLENYLARKQKSKQKWHRYQEFHCPIIINN